MKRANSFRQEGSFIVYFVINLVILRSFRKPPYMYCGFSLIKKKHLSSVFFVLAAIKKYHRRGGL